MELDYKGLTGWESLGFKSYEEYLESDMWRDTRRLIIAHYKKCQKCGSKKKLVVHHLNYYTVTNESIDDVTVLCWDCHIKEHEEKNGDNIS